MAPKNQNPRSPKRRVSLWAACRSFLQWSVGLPVMVFYVLSFSVMTLFVSHYKLEFYLKAFSKTMNWIAGIKLNVTGVEKIDWSKPHVIVFNHTNIFDHFVIYSQLPQITRGVEKESHFHWPIHGLFLRRIGQVPIAPKGDTRRAIESLEKAKELFRSGISIAIAPEGTRSATGELLPFKKGAFHMAIDLEASIVPIVLKGMYDIQRKGSFLLQPGEVQVEFLQEISTKGYDKGSVTQLRDTVRDLFVQRLATQRDAKERSSLA